MKPARERRLAELRSRASEKGKSDRCAKREVNRKRLLGLVDQ